MHLADIAQVEGAPAGQGADGAGPVPGEGGEGARPVGGAGVAAEVVQQLGDGPAVGRSQ